MKQLRIIILLLFGLLPALTAAGERPLVPYEGDAKDFSLADYKGNEHRLEDYRGKVVLVNFWASWCPPCIQEMPELTQLKNQLNEKPFEILAINVGEKKYKVRKFAKLINLKLPVLLDTKKDIFDDWGVKTLPTSFLIDAEGNIRYSVRGNPGWNQEDTIKIIEQLISENIKN